MDSVLLVEDDPPTRNWLVSQLLQIPSCAGVHACGTVAEACAWLAQHSPDILLVDLGLPDGSGLAVIKQTRTRHPLCEVLVLSVFGDERTVLAAIDAGASGYLVKDGNSLSLREHLECLRQGGSPLSPRIARTLIRRFQSPHADTGPAPLDTNPLLSTRETEVLTGLAKGFSYAEVAQALGITPNTVRTHVRKLYEKLSVNSRSEALYEYNRRQSELGQPPIR
ncbi:MAG: response regulator transcription factor [Rhizobacter sp.]